LAKKNFIKGLKVNGDHDMCFSDGCISITKTPFPWSIHAKTILEPMHYEKSCP
jgi:hypothetical protein